VEGGHEGDLRGEMREGGREGGKEGRRLSLAIAGTGQGLPPRA
jgi:hypothetical protein